MSASKVSNASRQRRSAAPHNQQRDNNQPTMAASASAAPRSIEKDAVPVPCPDNVPQLRVGYRKEIFERKEDQDKFSCGFCDKILREPVQADCGHRFCQNCQKAVEQSRQQGNRVLCRSCKEEGISDEESTLDPKQMFPDRGILREMTNLRTKCPNDTCDWQGPFKAYAVHEEECKHQPMVCEKCREFVSKQKIEQHKSRECSQRIIKCDHCQSDIVFSQRKNHLKECPKVPENCNQCSKNVPRDKMRKHQSQDCPNRMVTCPIEGCSGPQPQNRFQQHVQKDQTKHLAWVVSHISDIDETISTLMENSSPSRASAGGAARRADTLESVEILKGKLEQLEQQLQQFGRVQGASAPGRATGGAGGDLSQASGGAEASATADGNGGSSVERINAMEIKVGSLEPILSVLHGEMNRCIGAIEALETKLMRETASAQEVRQKIEQYENTISTMNTSLLQHEAKAREMEARIMILGQDKADGTLLWRIPNFNQVRKDAVAGTVTNIHSRPFYSGPLGYKMCVRLYPNGDGMGKGTHLSLFFSLMRSNNDALLPWPFKQKVYFMLIDQNFKKHIVDAFRSEPTSSSFQRPTSEMNIATGCPMFMHLNKLADTNHGYIKDNTMYIRVVVETEGLEDHFRQFDPRSMSLQQQ